MCVSRMGLDRSVPAAPESKLYRTVSGAGWEAAVECEESRGLWNQTDLGGLQLRVVLGEPPWPLFTSEWSVHKVITCSWHIVGAQGTKATFTVYDFVEAGIHKSHSEHRHFRVSYLWDYSTGHTPSIFILH